MLSIESHHMEKLVEREDAPRNPLVAAPALAVQFFLIPLAVIAVTVALMLDKPENPEFDHPSSIIYFNVEDIDQAAETLSARGVQFEAQPEFVADMGTYNLWLAAFRDSENNLLALMSHVPKKVNEA